MTFRKCLKCGWVHFGNSLTEVTAELARFREYFDSLTAKEQFNFYGGRCSSIEDYTSCFCCGNPHTNFRDATDEEVPYGSTLQPILTETEESPKD